MRGVDDIRPTPFPGITTESTDEVESQLDMVRARGRLRYVHEGQRWFCYGRLRMCDTVRRRVRCASQEATGERVALLKGPALYIV